MKLWRFRKLNLCGLAGFQVFYFMRHFLVARLFNRLSQRLDTNAAQPVNAPISSLIHRPRASLAQMPRDAVNDLGQAKRQHGNFSAGAIQREQYWWSSSQGVI